MADNPLMVSCCGAEHMLTPNNLFCYSCGQDLRSRPLLQTFAFGGTHQSLQLPQMGQYPSNHDAFQMYGRSFNTMQPQQTASIQQLPYAPQPQYAAPNQAQRQLQYQHNVLPLPQQRTTVQMHSGIQQFAQLRPGRWSNFESDAHIDSFLDALGNDDDSHLVPLEMVDQSLMTADRYRQEMDINNRYAINVKVYLNNAGESGFDRSFLKLAYNTILRAGKDIENYYTLQCNNAVQNNTQSGQAKNTPHAPMGGKPLPMGNNIGATKASIQVNRVRPGAAHSSPVVHRQNPFSYADMTAKPVPKVQPATAHGTGDASECREISNIDIPAEDMPKRGEMQTAPSKPKGWPESLPWATECRSRTDGNEVGYIDNLHIGHVRRRVILDVRVECNKCDGRHFTSGHDKYEEWGPYTGPELPMHLWCNICDKGARSRQFHSSGEHSWGTWYDCEETADISVGPKDGKLDRTRHHPRPQHWRQGLSLWKKLDRAGNCACHRFLNKDRRSQDDARKMTSNDTTVSTGDTGKPNGRGRAQNKPANDHGAVPLASFQKRSTKQAGNVPEKVDKPTEFHPVDQVRVENLKPYIDGKERPRLDDLIEAYADGLVTTKTPQGRLLHQMQQYQKEIDEILGRAFKLRESAGKDFTVVRHKGRPATAGLTQTCGRISRPKWREFKLSTAFDFTPYEATKFNLKDFDEKQLPKDAPNEFHPQIFPKLSPLHAKDHVHGFADHLKRRAKVSADYVGWLEDKTAKAVTIMLRASNLKSEDEKIIRSQASEWKDAVVRALETLFADLAGVMPPPSQTTVNLQGLAALQDKITFTFDAFDEAVKAAVDVLHGSKIVLAAVECDIHRNQYRMLRSGFWDAAWVPGRADYDTVLLRIQYPTEFVIDIEPSLKNDVECPDASEPSKK